MQKKKQENTCPHMVLQIIFTTVFFIIVNTVSQHRTRKKKVQSAYTISSNRKRKEKRQDG